MIQVKTFYGHNELRNFSYLIFNEASGESWVIDPYDPAPFIHYIKKNGLQLAGIFNTHQHFDHIRGNEELKRAFNASVKELSEDVFLDKDFTLCSLATPGHTLDHRAFLLKEKSVPIGLFSGDTLFNAGVGNCKNGGNVEMLFKTTMKLVRDLPSETRLYPGHDYIRKNLEFAKTCEPDNPYINEAIRKINGVSTEEGLFLTLAEEKLFNPFLRTSDKETFMKLRSLRDRW